FLIKAISTDSIVTRPTNMTMISTTLLPVTKPLVTPRDSPTVLYAEKHSNAISSNGRFGSKNEIEKIATPIVNSDRNIVAKALFIDIIPISRPISAYGQLAFVSAAALQEIGEQCCEREDAYPTGLDE